MSRLKIAYILSLAVMGVLIAFTVFQPMAMGGEYSEIQRAQLLEREGQWIIELDIFSHEAEDTDYNINVLVDGELYVESIRLRPGELFKYIHHIYRNKPEGKDVAVAIYKEGEAIPFEEMTYYLR
jgi:hypothetical protein